MQRQSLTESQVKALLTYLNSDANNPLSLITMLILETGCRQAEVLALRALDFDQGMVTIQPCKQSNPRKVRITNLLYNRLLAKLSSQQNASASKQKSDVLGGDEASNVVKLSQSSYARAARNVAELISLKASDASRLRMLRRYFEKVTLFLFDKKMHLHQLRHTWCINALRLSGNDIVKVSFAIGHKSVNSTAMYLKDIQASELIEEMNKYLRAL